MIQSNVIFGFLSFRQIGQLDKNLRFNDPGYYCPKLYGTECNIWDLSVINGQHDSEDDQIKDINGWNIEALPFCIFSYLWNLPFMCILNKYVSLNSIQGIS